MLRRAVIASLLVAFVGCSEGRLVSTKGRGGSGSNTPTPGSTGTTDSADSPTLGESADPAPAAQQGPRPRPTDGAEGVEGYLTDPARISATRAGDGTVTVSGVAGAVAANGAAAVTDVIVGVWVLEDPSPVAKDLTSGYVDLRLRNLACDWAGAGGEFSVRVNDAARLTVTAGAPCRDGAVRVARPEGAATRAVVESTAAPGRFENPYQTYEASCLCPVGQIFYDDSGSCEVPFDTCRPQFYPAGEHCGCDGRTYPGACEVIAARVKRYERGACR